MEAYAVVRAHGLKSRLLRRRDYELIARGERGLYEYADYGSVTEGGTLEERVVKVHRVYVARITLLARAAPELSPFLYALLDRLEYENAKIQLRRLAGVGAPALFYPYGRRIGPARLSALSSFEEFAEALAEAGLVERVPSGSVAELELALDVAYFAHLLGGVERAKVSGRSARALRGAALEECALALSRWSSILGSDRVLAAAEEVGLGAAAEALKGRPEGPWGPREVEEALVSRVAKRLEREHPLEPPFLYSFEIYARLEARNLERILTGLHLGLSADEILRACTIAL